MPKLFRVAQYIAPVVGLAGVAMIAIGARWEPQNLMLMWQGVSLAALGLLFRPRPGHPMAKHLGMHQRRTAAAAPKPEIPPEDAESRAFIFGFADQNAAVLTPEPVDVPHHAEPAKLVPCLPGNPGRGHSWIGGAPLLPEGMAWPEVNNMPLLFLAQIALHEVPEGIWGGLGPREGWLAFFIPSEGNIGKDSRVFHFTGPVAERAWPEVPYEFYFGFDGDKAREMLAAIGIHKRPHPPRFPVSVQRHEGPVECIRPDVPGERLRDTMQSDYDPRCPAFRPFDRPTASTLVQELTAEQHFLLNAFESMVEREEHSVATAEDEHARTAAQTRLDAGREVRRTHADAIDMLECIAAELTTHPKAPFGQAEADVLLAKLDAIRVSGLVSPGEGVAANSPPRSILESEWSLGECQLPFEMLVAEALRTDPDRVPHAVRARYEALWRYDQAREYGVMGGAVHKGFPYSCAEDPVFLLELPSSDLVGWMFGDVSRLGVFIAPKDLAEGRWDKVWGDILT